MSMINAVADEAEMQNRKRRFQSEIFSLETDLNHLKGQMNEVEADVRRTKEEIAHLESSLYTKEEARQTLVRKIAQTEMEMTQTKKKMAAL